MLHLNLWNDIPLVVVDVLVVAHCFVHHPPGCYYCFYPRYYYYYSVLLNTDDNCRIPVHTRLDTIQHIRQ